jgi:hypothetical protein
MLLLQSFFTTKNQAMLKTKKVPKGLVIATFLVIVVIGCQFTQQTLPADASSSCNSTITAADFNTWFDSGIVTLNGSVTPANSLTFPDIPNCSFYKWSERMFLWLTSPAPKRYGGGGGLIMGSPAFYDVSPTDADGNRKFIPHTPGNLLLFNMRASQLGAHDLPVVMEKNSARLLEVLKPTISPNGRQMVLNKAGQEVEIGSARLDKENRPVFLDVAGKEIEGPRAILRPQFDTVTKKRNLKLERMTESDKPSLVQKFTIDKNTIFLDLFGNVINVEQGQGGDGDVLMAQNGSLVYYAICVNQVFAYYRTMLGASVPAGTKFPLTQTDLNAITNFATAHGKTIIDSEALAIEVKSAWVEATGLPDSDKFITMQATIPTYDKSNPNEWVPNGHKTALLALVGIHVVGSTGSTNLSNTNHGHPEMLWASFEHVSATPSAGYIYAKASGTGTKPRTTAGNWVFCGAASGGPFNEAHMTMGGADFDHIVNKPGFTISPSNTLRGKPFGMDSTASTSNADLVVINNSVRNLLINGDLRKNYIQIGTTWTIFGGPGPGGVGTNKLANSTMETYQPGSNCFNCHSPNTTDVSFIFGSLQPLF